jgi:hypothetical protein
MAEGSTEASLSGSPPTAVVLIERTVAGGENARAEAVARFVRMRAGAVDDEALRLVGAAIDFPPPGTCALATEEEGRENAVGRAVELVDVGAVSVEVNGASLSLLPRRLPDIVDLVSGVFYSTRPPDADALPSGATYILRAGADEVFAVTSRAPDEPGNLRIGGQDAKTPGGLVLPSDAGIEISWGSGNPEDSIYVDVAQLGSSGMRSARCLFGDTGHAVLPTSVVVEGGGTVAVHRLHRETFQARGFGTGEIRFDFARVVAFRR